MSDVQHVQTLSAAAAGGVKAAQVAHIPALQAICSASCFVILVCSVVCQSSATAEDAGATQL
jgi:hypothetical protein